jgi:hypothetical protein
MPTVYIKGEPQSERERELLLADAFDAFMLKTPIEQRRFLRKFGLQENEIDQILKNPDSLSWQIKAD